MASSFSYALHTDDEFMTQDYRRLTGELSTFPPRSMETVKRLAIKDTRFHDLYQRCMELFSEAQAIYLVRHPGGMLNSWWRSKEFPAKARFADEWRGGACRKSEGPGEYWGFDDWRDLTMRFLALERQAPARYRVCRYEELVRDRVRIASELFEFAGCALRPETLAFLEESESRHDDRTYAVFKKPSVAERWRSELPDDIQEAIPGRTGRDTARGLCVVILGVMQPYFFPYLEHFRLIATCDRWIIFDMVFFRRKTWMSRNRIINRDKSWNYISVPVAKGATRGPVSTAGISRTNWRADLADRLRVYAYEAPYYDETCELVREIVAPDHATLADLNTCGLRTICRYLEIETPCERLSEMTLDLPARAEPDEWGLLVSKALGADEYRNAAGGRELFDAARFEAAESG